MQIKQIFHPYWLWEEHKYGMWKTVLGEKRNYLLVEAVRFTGDHDLYGLWMMKVISDWPYSCEHNLTNLDMNRQAWIGHAACCYAIQCPEDITRLAWHNLTKEQQDLANLKADKAITAWERLHIKRAERTCLKSNYQLTFSQLLESA